MQNRIFQGSAKFMHGKIKKKKFDTFTYTSLGFNSSFKNRFQEAFWLELSILKNTLHALNPLIPGGNK